ncbi:MAG: 50S ribosomal protein L25 [Anaerolineae bacterium]|nr:50S ribosomal protein L25 [Anaerolineae bacterium]
MAETYTLDAESRSLIGKKVRQLRVKGLVPAVIYGARVDPIVLQIPYRPLELALRDAGGTRLININYGANTQSVIAREVQRDVLRGTIIHVDFLAVDASTRISADIAIRLVGESPAMQTRIGELVHQTQTLSIEAVPADLIDSIDVDISGLREVGDAIHVRDLNVNPNITVLSDPEELIVRINALREVAAEEETEGEETETATSEPELVTRRRAEEAEDEE